MRRHWLVLVASVVLVMAAERMPARSTEGKDAGKTLHQRAEALEKAGKLQDAARLYDRDRRRARRHLAAILPGLTEAEKPEFWKNTGARSSLDQALSLGLAHKDDAAVAALSASWLLNGKAVDQESLAASVLMARRASEPKLSKLSQRLLSIRQQLARLNLSTARPGQEKQRLKQIDDLASEERALVKQLGEGTRVGSWVELAEVRKALPADAVLIDVAYYWSFESKAKPGKSRQRSRYAAWVTPKKGQVVPIDLGPAEKIDEAVKQFREAIKDAPAQIKNKGEKKAEKTLRKHLGALSRLVLTPLLPHIGKSKRWLVCPDGNLWLVPWEAFILKNGKYAIENHQISYLSSGRDLLPSVAPKVKVTVPLVFADPDFDLDPKKGRAEPRRLLGKERDEEGVRSLSGTLNLGKIRRLPGTAAQAKAIAPSLKTYAGVAPRVYLRERALEAVFKAARNPRVVVFCTHGFYLPEQDGKRDKGGRSTPKAVKKWENPLLRCGLLLAGCNHAAKAGDADDGVLTGLEVVAADLRGCELVVLSAGDSGLGPVVIGEGVIGLRHAFQLAGARAVVATLWQVPDKASARLTTLFFKGLAKGQNKAEALRAAKLKVIEESRKSHAAAHPFCWAGFTLTSQ
jgi:CHAT domain-containing protein